MIRSKTRHRLFLPDELSRRLTAMAKSQKRARSDLLLEMVETYMSRRSGPQVDDRILAKLDRIARAVDKDNDECLVISHTPVSLYPPSADVRCHPSHTRQRSQALGEKRYQKMLDDAVTILAKGADSDDQLSKPAKADEA
jgi:predicted transcriptional regulator